MAKNSIFSVYSKINFTLQLRAASGLGGNAGQLGDDVAQLQSDVAAEKDRARDHRLEGGRVLKGGWWTTRTRKHVLMVMFSVRSARWLLRVRRRSNSFFSFRLGTEIKEKMRRLKKNTSFFFLVDVYICTVF